MLSLVSSTIAKSVAARTRKAYTGNDAVAFLSSCGRGRLACVIKAHYRLKAERRNRIDAVGKITALTVLACERLPIECQESLAKGSMSAIA